MINDTYDFNVGRRLCNLEDLKKIGFAANRRLLRVQRISHDCAIGAEAFDELHPSRVVDRQRASALRFDDPRVQALLAALLSFRVLPDGFQNRDLRETVAPLIGLSVSEYSRMTYDLRRLRLRLHGLIERIPFTKRYRVTDDGLRTALCYQRTYARVVRPAISVAFDAPARSVSRLNRAIKSFDHEIQRFWEGYDLARILVREQSACRASRASSVTRDGPGGAVYCRFRPHSSLPYSHGRHQTPALAAHYSSMANRWINGSFVSRGPMRTRYRNCPSPLSTSPMRTGRSVRMRNSEASASAAYRSLYAPA